MNWLLFAILAWLMLGFESGFRAALQIGSLAIAPSFVLVLVVFIALWARTSAVLGAALVMGFFLDLLYVQQTTGGESVAVVGPWALGCMLASYTVLNFRNMVFRTSPLTMAFLCTLGAAIANILVLAILTIRARYDVLVMPSPASELWQRLGAAVYTGVLGLVMAPALNWIAPWLGLKKQSAGGFRYEAGRR